MHAPDAPTPTREEVVAWLQRLAATEDYEDARGDLMWIEQDRVVARAALSRLTPDPWAEADAEYFDEEADEAEETERRSTAARYRRAAQRARGATVTEDGRP